jgi:hypothetical protein
MSASAITALAKQLGSALIPVLAKTLGNRIAGEKAAEQVLAEIDLKKLSNVADLAAKEIDGNELQRSWRPMWMHMLRRLLRAYFALTFVNLIVIFVGIITSRPWATSEDMMWWLEAWLGVGVSLVALSTASFSIYAIGRSTEKVNDADGNLSVGGSLIDAIKNLPGIRRMPNTKTQHNSTPPVYSTSNSNTESIHEQADRVVLPDINLNNIDRAADPVSESTWEPYAPQTGRRIPPEWGE